MKKVMLFILALSFITAFIPAMALALDVMLQAPITRTDTFLDKNGNEYVRIIVAENKTLNGVAYQTETPVMAFGTQVGSAKALKAGTDFKGICETRSYEGRVSYTVLKILDK